MSLEVIKTEAKIVVQKVPIEILVSTEEIVWMKNNLEIDIDEV